VPYRSPQRRQLDCSHVSDHGWLRLPLPLSHACLCTSPALFDRLAARWGKLDVVRYFLSQSAAFTPSTSASAGSSSVPKRASTTISGAALSNEKVCSDCRIMLDSLAGVNARFLSCADKCLLLIMHGILQSQDIALEQRTADGMTALMIAVNNDYIDCAVELIKAGANTQVTTKVRSYHEHANSTH